MEEEKYTSQKVYKAAQIFNLGKKASREEIEKKYKKLIKKWHPDNCPCENEKCQKKTKEIVKAYEILQMYCDNYLFSFKKKEIINNIPVDMRLEETWKKRFKGKM